MGRVDWDWDAALMTAALAFFLVTLLNAPVGFLLLACAATLVCIAAGWADVKRDGRKLSS